jgi:hypothetical protein
MVLIVSTHKNSRQDLKKGNKKERNGSNLRVNCLLSTHIGIGLAMETRKQVTTATRAKERRRKLF